MSSRASAHILKVPQEVAPSLKQTNIEADSRVEGLGV